MYVTNTPQNDSFAFWEKVMETTVVIGSPSSIKPAFHVIWLILLTHPFLQALPTLTFEFINKIPVTNTDIQMPQCVSGIVKNPMKSSNNKNNSQNVWMSSFLHLLNHFILYGAHYAVKFTSRTLFFFNNPFMTRHRVIAWQQFWHHITQFAYNSISMQSQYYLA